MEKWYDKDEDVLNIQIADKEYWKSLEMPNGVVIDISNDGSIIGIEILKASKIFSGQFKKVIQNALVSH